MAHTATRRSRLAGDKRHHWLANMFPYVLRRSLLGIATDFADHDDGFCFGIFVEQSKSINERRSNDRIAADADGCRLSNAALRELIDGFVGQRSGSGNDANIPLLVDAPGHDPDLAFARRDDARAIRTYQPRTFALEILPSPHHVHHWNAFGNAYN